MNSFIAEFRLVVSALLLILFASCTAFHQTVQVSSSDAQPVSQAESVVRQAYSQLKGRQHDNLIVYVHGRGDGRTMAKSNTKIIPRLESDYTAEVVSFHWNAAKGFAGLGYPEDNARAAAPDFARLVAAVRKVSQENQAWKKVRITLLFHSLGAVVAEEFARTTQGLPDSLFSNVVLSSPSVTAREHATWVSKLAPNRLYVLLNPNDPVLRWAAKEKLSAMLGQRLADITGKHFKTDPRVTYIDLDNLKEGHRSFQPKSKRGHELWLSLLNGLPPALRSTEREPALGAKVYKVENDR